MPLFRASPEGIAVYILSSDNLKEIEDATPRDAGDEG
jgi:hypothetical protein